MKKSEQKKLENQILEGGKLIAEFMGFKIGDAWQVWNKTADYSNDAEFEYHSSWDYLIAAWSKLYKLFDQIERNEERTRNDAMNFADTFSIRVHEGNCLAAFFIMVEGLTWYRTTFAK